MRLEGGKIKQMKLGCHSCGGGVSQWRIAWSSDGNWPITPDEQCINSVLLQPLNINNMTKNQDLHLPSAYITIGLFFLLDSSVDEPVEEPVDEPATDNFRERAKTPVTITRAESKMATASVADKADGKDIMYSPQFQELTTSAEANQSHNAKDEVAQGKVDSATVKPFTGDAAVLVKTTTAFIKKLEPWKALMTPFLLDDMAKITYMSKFIEKNVAPRKP